MPPERKPNAAGSHAGTSISCDISIAGIRRDQMLAAIITPPANPSMESSILLLMSFLRNTAAAPSAVIPHVNPVARSARTIDSGNIGLSMNCSQRFQHLPCIRGWSPAGVVPAYIGCCPAVCAQHVPGELNKIKYLRLLIQSRAEDHHLVRHEFFSQCQQHGFCILCLKISRYHDFA